MEQPDPQESGEFHAPEMLHITITDSFGAGIPAQFVGASDGILVTTARASFQHAALTPMLVCRIADERDVCHLDFFYHLRKSRLVPRSCDHAPN